MERDAHLFDGVACYLDHPELTGLGWRGEPQVKNLVGAFHSVRWDPGARALTGTLRLYDDHPHSPGAFVRHITDHILADAAQGLPVPEVGLSAVFYHESGHDEHTGHRVTQAFTKVESIDIVYAPGAGGYIKQALSALPAHERSTIMPEELEHTQHDDEEEPTLQDAMYAVAELASRVGQLSAQVQALSADLDGTPEVELAQTSATVEDLHAQVQHLTRVLTQHESRATVQGMGGPPAQREALPARFSLASPLDELQTAWDWVFGVDGAPLPNPELRRTDYLYRLLSGDLSWTGVFNPREALATASTTTLADMAVNAMNKVIIALYDRLDAYGWPHTLTDDQILERADGQGS